MLGNRGVLHDDHREIVRSAQVRRWICCVLERSGVRRVPMTPRTWTELFFLDEATAFSAGHRPCFECRRQAALEFQSCWAKALGGSLKADEMDRILASERRDRAGRKKTHLVELADLPDGALVVREGSAWLVHQHRLWRWTPAGYADPERRPNGLLEVLTPPATVAVLRAGYAPGVHSSVAQE